MSVSFSNHDKKPKPPAEPIIEAVAIDQSALDKQVKRLKAEKDAARRAEEKRVRDLERRAENAKKNRLKQESDIKKLDREKKKAADAAKVAKAKQKKEQEKAKKLEKQRKQKELEKKKADEAAALATKKRKAEEAKAKKAKEERERKLREAKLEKERKEKEAKQRAEQERLMAEQLAQEQTERRAARRTQVMGEVQKYTALITQKIQQNLIVDESFKGKVCRLNVRLAFNGLVTSVKILSGDKLLCQAAQRAVFKAETLPVSKEADIYNELKDINLTVEPEF